MENLNESEQIELHSEETEEIMGRVPSWVIRCGISVIAFVIGLLLIGSYYFRYPEYVSSPVKVVNCKRINGFVTGYMNVQPAFISKVRVGQDVRVSLIEYSEDNYGYLMGKVFSLSYEPNSAGTYSAIIIFPEGLRTNYTTISSPLKVINGNAEILIGNDRLIERFITPIKRSIKMSER